ncbi:zona pellucida sperm-binding protein 3-like [Hemicordylus capensis]|uniref:zona pellucida sperm-binding protein 3-like n=1 Tax=Hemicordylus capensis TaxID=884348 RepID=UPI0023045242|nr:zona pellucida sperm-binding protein 3-like [Hemicordylus capensis]
MGCPRNLGMVFFCWLLSAVGSYDPWDFSARNPAVWRPLARTVPPVRQPYGPPIAQPYPWAWVDASQPRALSQLTPVKVQCGEAQVVVTVDRDLFGTGRLVQATDLFLGSAGCRHTSMDAAGKTVGFEVGLHECGSALQMTPELLIYSITLYYKPTPTNNAVIVRTSPAEVPIECHYARRSNVSSKAIKPTWVPFSSTLSAEEKLVFSLRLMNDDWSAERSSNGYQLGDVMHIQADVNTENHVALRLFIDSCVATLSPERDSTPRYTLIDYKGCLVDGRSGSSSTFRSPRIQEDSLQFAVEVFRFAEDPRDLIYIHCHLKVAAADQPADHENKACSFNRASNIWIPVEGTRDICSCCESGNCGLTGGQPRRPNTWDRWAGGRRSGRDVASKHNPPKEMDLLLGPVFIHDVHTVSRISQTGAMEASTAEHGWLATPGILVGLILMAIAMVLALLTVGILLLPKRQSSSP